MLHDGGFEAVFAGAAHTGGDGVEQGIDEAAHVIAHVGMFEIGSNDADAAVDVVTDAARRDDPAFVRIGRGRETDSS